MVLYGRQSVPDAYFQDRRPRPASFLNFKRLLTRSPIVLACRNSSSVAADSSFTRATEPAVRPAVLELAVSHTTAKKIFP